MKKKKRLKKQCDEVETEQVRWWWAVPVYPDHVHLLTVLHEVPDFGSHLLPHPAQVLEHTELLEGPVHLNAP